MVVICDDCLAVVPRLREQHGRMRCGIADPPDNIGLAYNGYRDKMPDHEYRAWVRRVVQVMVDSFEVIWLSTHSKHEEWTGHAVYGTLPAGWRCRTIIWRFTFGQYSEEIGYGYRPIRLITMPDTILNYDRIREESERMRIGDKRTATWPDGSPKMRVPDDVWDVPRVVGNSPERQQWHPTQHPVLIYDRMLKLSCPPGSIAVDLFAGSGTIFRAARLNPNVTPVGIEVDQHYCREMGGAQGGANVGGTTKSSQ